MTGEMWVGPATDEAHGFNLGQTVLENVHPREVCEAEGSPCVLHSPSDHHMRDWPTLWRADRRLMERICPCHGIGHPDPDDLAFHVRQGRAGMGIHGCVVPSCCRPPETAPCPTCGRSTLRSEEWSSKQCDDCFLADNP
jgi:hypothetical protein